MSDDPKPLGASDSSEFGRKVAAKASRKIKAQKHSSYIWLGLGMMGLVGWSVVVPTLLGAAIGIWLDHRKPGQHSWTLAFMSAGLTIGCWNAWHWISKEDRAIQAEQEENHD